jgi:Mrp family chromosome partitioning ATPase
MAQAIARTLTEEFLEEHVKVSATVGSLSFFEEQAKEAEHKLSDMLMKRSGLLKERKISSVAAQHETLGSQLGSLEKSLLSARSSLQQSMAEINDLEGKASSAELEIVATKQKQGDQTWSLMRNKLYELEMEESRLASQYTPSHARLGQVREQLTSAKLILSKLESEREDHSTTLNPVRLRIEEDLQRTKTAVAGLESLIAETESQRETKQQEIRELLDFEVMLGQLDREIAVSESSLRLLQEKQEEARVIDELRGKHISSIGVFQPASFVERPVSPKKPVLAAAFGLMGLLGGIGWVFMREMTSTTFRTPEQVERDLELPVLSTIPFSARLAKLRRFPRPQHLQDIRVSCRSILSEILLSRPMIHGNQYRGKTIGILGVEEGGGASTVAVGLALASSEDAGLRTTLIDFDLTKRTVSSAFDLNGSPGFAELVAGEADQEDCVQHFKKRPLSLIAGSAARSNRRFEAEPLEVMRVLNELRDANALVIVDLPPASRPDQTLSIAQHIDHVIVVVESEKTGLVEAKRLIRQLEASNADVVGIILNKSRTYLPNWLSGLLR